MAKNEKHILNIGDGKNVFDYVRQKVPVELQNNKKKKKREGFRSVFEGNEGKIVPQ